MSRVTGMAVAFAAYVLARSGPAAADELPAPSSPSTTADAGDDPPAAPPEAAPSSDPPAAFEPADDSDFSGADGGYAEARVAPLQISGFADFGYNQLIARRSSVWRNLSQRRASFALGNLNLYLGTAQSTWWRALAEVRFTFLPNGALDIRDDGTGEYLDTTVPDYRRLNRDTRVGSIVLERAALELTASQYLNVRLGKWLTPYGVWNVDHGSPTVIATDQPYAIAEELFPEHQTGVSVDGSVYIRAVTLSYMATLSNGRGPIDDYHDLDANKAIGGRVWLTAPLFGSELTLGTSVYRGAYTAVSQTFGVDASGDLEADAAIDIAYDELSYAGDLRFTAKGLLLQAEVIGNDVHFAAGERQAPFFPTANAVVADYRRLGGYVLLGYRTPWLGVMPFVIGQHLNFADRDILPPATGMSWGLNVRPVPELVFKAEYLAGTFIGASSVGIHDPVRFLRFQAAWAF